MSGFDREKFTVKRVEVQRKGEEPYNGDPYEPRSVEVVVSFYDGNIQRRHTVEYKIEGSTAVFNRNQTDREATREIHVKSPVVADEVVAELPFVQAVESLADAVAEVNA